MLLHEQLIADLDAVLAVDGEDVTLQRTSATGGELVVAASVSVRAFVRGLGRGYQAHDLGGNLTQQDYILIMSPTEIIAAAWSSGRPAGEDTKIPMRGNKVLIKGRRHNVEAAEGIYVGGVLVRIEVQARA